jgi:hypothetical protein
MNIFFPVNFELTREPMLCEASYNKEECSLSGRDAVWLLQEPTIRKKRVASTIMMNNSELGTMLAVTRK